ncbi:DUF6882 domain-containing protein [Nocardia sp. NPDC059240]|uniref:DUF6882 domain-containing protein n=1 Tax=Nocardia sp. NPDC059240 TaxID=3346786 RepID=UPI00369BF8B6
MRIFSDNLTALVRETLPGAMQRYAAFSAAITPGHTRAFAESATVRIGDRVFARSGNLGSFAEDRTFMWAWAHDFLHGRPGIEWANRLREIGTRHDVPELTTAVVDLSEFDDPWLAADQLALIAMAVLDVRGMTKFNHGGRAYTYVTIDDPTVPVTAPVPGRIDVWERAAAQLLAGEIDRTVNTGGPAPADGGPAFLADSLLAELAPGAAIAMGMRGGLFEAEPDLDAVPELTSTWDRTTQHFYFAQRPDLRFEATEIGHFHPVSNLWQWSDSGFAGIAAVRALAAEHGNNYLAADKVSLTESTAPNNLAALLSAAAAHRGGAVGWLQLSNGAGRHALAITDPRVALQQTDPDHACGVLEDAADLLHPLTRTHNRYPTMHSLVTGFLEFHNTAMLYIGEPHFTGALFGLYEFRAEFGSEGGLIRTDYGLMGTLSTGG